MKKETIYRLVKATGLQPGELVLVHFWGEDADKPTADAFCEAVAAQGGSPFLLQQSRSRNRDLFTAASPDAFNERYFALLSGFDAVLDIFACRPIVLGYEIGEQYELYRRYIRQLFGALMKAPRFTQLRLPTEANAEESELSPNDYIARMEAAYDIDYAALAARCQEASEALQPLSQLTLQTGRDAALHFDLTGRSWLIDAGDGDLPCGEVYIAPVEHYTYGSVYFDKLYLEDVGVFDGVTLFAEAGRLTSSDHSVINAYLSGLPSESKVICELGLGMNPQVGERCGYTVLDEKMAGSFHIAIGANRMFGGENDAAIHLDMVGTDFTLTR